MFTKSYEDGLSVVLAAVIQTHPELTTIQAAKLTIQYLVDLDGEFKRQHEQTSVYNRPVKCIKQGVLE